MINPQKKWPTWSAYLFELIIILHTSSASPTVNEQTSSCSEDYKLLFIIMDGFRWDYVDMQSKSELPAFAEFLENGVKAEWLEPPFPTVSFASWTSLDTGVHPETHNIIGNDMYDRNTGAVFTLANLTTTANKKWWTQEPIWITAKKAGCKTALHLWSRCDVAYDDIKPDYCTHFGQERNDENKFYVNMQKALSQLEKGYNFVQLYTPNPDGSGHNHGPDSEEVRFDVRLLDDAIGVLLQELKAKKLDDKVNIVIVSDHGMSKTNENYELDDYLDSSLVEKIISFGPFMNIAVPPRNIQTVYDQLSKIPKVKVYKKEDMPEEWHYKHGKYVLDIFVLADDGNFVSPSKSEKQIPLRKPDFSVIPGNHGYGKEDQNMNGIFFAKGPLFEKNKVIPAVHVVDVYQALASVLDINPRLNDGSWERIQKAFKPEHRKLKPAVGSSARCTVSALLLFFILVSSVII